ncbi:MAG: LysR family transcriptional regulator, partial [Oscillospiraceae bacterium]|nr:LysR family transcriptional regulator [Oscillospiraceae bacterium]
MDIRTLTTFLYVAELNSFTRAGDALGYSQSTVSFQIKQLESELGVHLFERVNHTISLTDKGREVLQYTHRILRLAQDLETTLKESDSVAGHIRLAMADSLCPLFFNENYMRYRSRYPGISIKITAVGTEEMFRQLNRNEADLVFTLDNHIYHAEYRILQEKKIAAHFVAAASHPLAARDRLSVQELMGEPFLLTEQGMSYRRLLDEQLAARSLEIVPVLEMGNAERICQLVGQNAGLSFLPDYV